MKLQTTIGLEIHVQLKTKTKMFCRCANVGDKATPNTSICPICMGHPGTLPVANKQAILFTLKIGRAIGSSHPAFAKFDRKNYFYPDLPKGYQISQYDIPFCLGGELDVEVNDQKRAIRFRRVHLEEDAAKLVHTPQGSLVDYNRAGTPLAEMVTEPDMHSAEEAGAFLRNLRTLLRYLDVSDADMEKGHMRCDANISVQDVDRNVTTAIVEMKNLNSFRSVEAALRFEEQRLGELVKEGREGETKKETRGWNDAKKVTVSQRSKEEASDYRYFPDPDLPPVAIDESLLQDEILKLPELPWQKQSRFQTEFGLDHETNHILTSDPALAAFFEQVVSELDEWLDAEGKEQPKERVYKLATNWILAEILKHLNKNHQTMADIKFSPENFAEFITLIQMGKMNSSAAQTVLEEMYLTGADPTEVMVNKNLEQVSDSGALETAVEKVLAANPNPVADYKAGKQKALQFLVGQVMKEMRGKANPMMLQEIFERKLK